MDLRIFLSNICCFVVTAGFLNAAPVKVFVLAGQSNMEGKAKVSLMEFQATQPATKSLYSHLRNPENSGWNERDDVFIKFLSRTGKLTVGYGSRDRIGPELQFGHVVGEHFDESVLIIKTAWGGKSLARDFRPPSSGMPEKAELESLLARLQKKKPKTTLAEVEASFGQFYRLMIEDVKKTVSEVGDYVPGAESAELAGFVWFQGWNDMVNEKYTAEYAGNMANFIRDVRKDLNAPGLPFVIGQLGVGGTNDGKRNPKRDKFKAAQIEPAALAEFRGNVAVVKTDQYWDEEAAAIFKKGWKQNVAAWEKVGSDYPFHYLGSAKTMLQIGGGFGEAMLELIQ